MRVSGQSQIHYGSAVSNYSQIYSAWDNAEEEICPDCRGTGLDRDEYEDCPACYGEGVLPPLDRSLSGLLP